MMIAGNSTNVLPKERRTIALSAVRNELHNLRTVLPAWKAFCHHIILCDQMSEDGSREWLAREHPDVILIDNSGADYDERVRGNLLIDECRRRFGLDNVLLYPDADETLCSGVFDSMEWKNFCSSPTGTAGAFPWINFWISPETYISNGPFGSVSYNRCAFIDDGRPIGGANLMHGMRGPGGDARDCFHFTGVRLLHYGFVPFQKNVLKQHWYKVWWRSRGGRNFHTNRNHNLYHQVHASHTTRSDAKWFEGYQSRGIDVQGLHYPGLSWHMIDVLRRFQQYGVDKFHGLDIWWDIDWESIRSRAESEGVDGIPVNPIKSPSILWRIPCELSRGPGGIGRCFNIARRLALRKLIP